MEILPNEQTDRRLGPHGEWLQRIGDIVTVGLTRGAVDQLGQIVHIELPAQHTQLARGDTAVVIESSKAATDCEAPLSGTVAAVNTGLYSDPDVINESPELAGWLYRLSHINEQEWRDMHPQEV